MSYNIRMIKINHRYFIWVLGARNSSIDVALKMHPKLFFEMCGLDDSRVLLASNWNVEENVSTAQNGLFLP